MRLIDADKLCKDIVERGAQLSGCYSAGIARYMDRMLAHVLAEVDIAPTIDAVPRWISCEERLPEPNVAVLGYAPTFNNIYAVYYDSDRGWMTWCPVYDEPFPSFQGKIVAWMPMPAPYEGERRNDERVYKDSKYL